MKKNQMEVLEMKNIIFEIKNPLHGFNSSEGKVTELEDKTIEINVKNRENILGGKMNIESQGPLM